ncbi:ferredoxin reductase family protein [Sansalvadorimonas verongulae]|uniref:ferredoxin reductase family protein n=1 Tax=Sansalvadorimonas verongulae TaxID=2172824 RepID=UPI0012BB4F5D|nr:ferric reductase-like transmembrane domain-containing protein [Sansalvadorimonas verongulae]MTI11950.1 hypothetical protein [Sansalvadorimonas verongulae]
MSNLSKKFVGVLVAITLLWLVSYLFTYEQRQNVIMQYSGILAIASMSLAMILSTRPVWLESYLNGLDKGYRIHKWLGITALIASLFHWGWTTIPDWFSPEDHGGHRGGGRPVFTGIQGWLHDFRGPARDIGEIAFYVIVVILILSLIKKLSYRHFALLHKFVPVLYLALVCHSVVFMAFSYWVTPIGIVIGLLMLAGAVSAFYSLFGLIGKNNKVKGNVSALLNYKKMDSLEVSIQVENGWKGHKPGQFAFLTIQGDKESHPFTLSSSWDQNNSSLSFIIKSLGDYTSKMVKELRVGDQVTVEGPYGKFNFQDACTRQIWVAGGIGITPFLAQLEALAANGNSKPVDLFYMATNVDSPLMTRLQTLCEKTNVTLHDFVGQPKGSFNGNNLRSLVPAWQTASIWFCGPSGLGNMLKTDLFAHGFKKENLHQELFEMR